MEQKHKTMAITVLAALAVIAVISNVSALSQIKNAIFGKSGWF